MKEAAFKYAAMCNKTANEIILQIILDKRKFRRPPTPCQLSVLLISQLSQVFTLSIRDIQYT